MPINDRNLKPGTRLVGKYHKQTYTCEVVEVDGKLKFRLQDGREFKSPSAAGMAITGKSCNGWAFWSVETATSAAQPPTQTQPAVETKATGEAQPADASQEAVREQLWVKLRERDQQAECRHHAGADEHQRFATDPLQHHADGHVR